MPTCSVTSSRSCQRIVVTSKPPSSWRVSTMRRAAGGRDQQSPVRERRTARRWIAQASSVSPAINTERSCASGFAEPRLVRRCRVAHVRQSLQSAAYFFLTISARNSRSFCLDDALVRRSHADQQFLPGRAALQIRIRILVEHLRLHELDRAVHLRRLQQLIDDLHQAVVEVLARITEILVRLLEQRVETLVHHGERLHVGRLDHVHERRVAREVARRSDVVRSPWVAVTVWPGVGFTGRSSTATSCAAGYPPSPRCGARCSAARETARPARGRSRRRGNRAPPVAVVERGQRRASVSAAIGCAICASLGAGGAAGAAATGAAGGALCEEYQNQPPTATATATTAPPSTPLYVARQPPDSLPTSSHTLERSRGGPDTLHSFCGCGSRHCQVLLRHLTGDGAAPRRRLPYAKSAGVGSEAGGPLGAPPRVTGPLGIGRAAGQRPPSPSRPCGSCGARTRARAARECRARHAARRERGEAWCAA